MPSADHDGPQSVRVAVAQPRGFPFQTDAAVDRVCEWTAQAGEEGAALALFPEAFVGGYPWGLIFGTAVGGRSPAGRRTFTRSSRTRRS